MRKVRVKSGRDGFKEYWQLTLNILSDEMREDILKVCQRWGCKESELMRIAIRELFTRPDVEKILKK